jgi:PEGA domain
MGARVTVDGRLVGTTPLVITEVSAGSHRVQIEADRHKPWTTTVDVPPGQRVRVAGSLEEGTPQR